MAASPFESGLVAVVAQRVDWEQMCNVPALSLSRDGGRTWRATHNPWDRSCRTDIHAVLAWGPGPGEGTSRLWIANAVPHGGGLALAVSFSDTYGASWSRPYVQEFTPPWVGCVPVIAVDNSHASRNFGTVYLAYNFRSGPTTAAIAVLASRDGVSWRHANVEPLGKPGYDYRWSFGPRLAIAIDGSVHLSFYEADMHRWDESDLFHANIGDNIGRAGFVIARLDFRTELTATPARWVIDLVPSDQPAFDPECQSSLAVGQSGDLWLAVNDRPPGGARVHLGRSADGGQTWAWTIAGTPGLDSFKPSLAVHGRLVFLGWHAFDRGRLVRTYYAISYDGGASFGPSQAVTRTSYRLPDLLNDVGIRENADFETGRVYYAWGDNRTGTPEVRIAAIEP